MQEITTESGAKVEIWLFSDFLGAGSAALISTKFDHLLNDDEKENWYPNSEFDEPMEYAPARMAWEDWFDATGEVA